MLVSCSKTCKYKNSTTDAGFNEAKGVAECRFCGEEIALSKFSLGTMRSQGDIIEEQKRPLAFDCKKCNKNVQCFMKGDILTGRECPNENIGCNINITEAMKVVIGEYGSDGENENE